MSSLLPFLSCSSVCMSTSSSGSSAPSAPALGSGSLATFTLGRLWSLPGAGAQVAANAERIFAELEREEMRFVGTLERGEEILEEMMAKAEAAETGLSGRDASSSLAY